MLGPGTQHVYLPERYRDCDVFKREIEAKFGQEYFLRHIAPSGRNVYFQSDPMIPSNLLQEFQNELWDKR